MKDTFDKERTICQNIQRALKTQNHEIIKLFLNMISNMELKHTTFLLVKGHLLWKTNYFERNASDQQLGTIKLCEGRSRNILWRLTLENNHDGIIPADMTQDQ